MKKLLIIGAILLIAVAAWAQMSTKGTLPHCTYASIIGGTCVPEFEGNRVWDTTVSRVLAYEGLSTTGWSPSACQQVLWGIVNPTEAQVTPDYIDPRDHAGSTTEGNEDTFLMPNATMLVSNLACTVDVAPGAGDIWTIDVRVGTPGALADTALDCTISGAAATTCSNSADIVLADTTDAITIGIESDDGASDPDAAASIDCRFCLGNY